MDSVASEYVRLVLSVGQHDPDYVDAYYGPAEWRTEAAANVAPLEEIQRRAVDAQKDLATYDAPDELSVARKRALGKQLDALSARATMLVGAEMTFDEESAALYDVVAPTYDDAYYDGILAELEPLLPGNGPLNERFDRLRERFTIPADRLPAVFDVAIETARARTKRHIELPEHESFRVEYVKEQVWGAYNWYEGNAHSLIQVNTDLPLPIGSPLHLAFHEGYPGHHVYNALLEQRLAGEKGWIEYTIYPLFSPQSLIAEGTAEYGFELGFPKEERRAFERETLFPLAGLDPSGVDEYHRSIDLIHGLGYASNDAGRRYLDGHSTREETLDWLVAHALQTPERADRQLRFIERNRSYVVTYNVGLDLVRRYVESRADSVADRWKVFTRLLSTPQTPSGLIEAF